MLLGKWNANEKTVECAYGDDSSILPSLIRFKPWDEISDCVIDEYRFEWLITSSDYQKAGQIMHNCLGSTYQPTVAIKSNGVYIAAISFDVLNYKNITQAFMCGNQPIINDTPLCIAIQKWCERYDIEWPDDEYEDVPF